MQGRKREKFQHDRQDKSGVDAGDDIIEKYARRRITLVYAANE